MVVGTQMRKWPWWVPSGGQHDSIRQSLLLDALRAAELVRRLEPRGVDCWIAPRDVSLGVPYADAIIKAIQRREIFVLLLTPAAADSAQVLRELERAVHHRRRVCAVVPAGFALPLSFEYFLRAMQAAGERWEAPTHGQRHHRDRVFRSEWRRRGSRVRSSWPTRQPSWSRRSSRCCSDAAATSRGGGAILLGRSSRWAAGSGSILLSTPDARINQNLRSTPDAKKATPAPG